MLRRLTITALPPDTILYICRLLVRWPKQSSRPPRQRHLAALATTCSYLSDPALDVLWHTLASLVPLLEYTLPKDLCGVVSAAATRTWGSEKYRLVSASPRLIESSY